MVLHVTIRSNAELGLLAVERMENGQLPWAIPPRRRVQFGSGQLCQLCRERIGIEQLSYKLAGRGRGNGLTLHYRCFQAWELECGAWALEASRAEFDVTPGARNRDPQLESADRHFRIGLDQIIRQMDLVERLKQRGRDTKFAAMLLAEFEVTHDLQASEVDEQRQRLGMRPLRSRASSKSDGGDEGDLDRGRLVELLDQAEQRLARSDRCIGRQFDLACKSLKKGGSILAWQLLKEFQRARGLLFTEYERIRTEISVAFPAGTQVLEGVRNKTRVAIGHKASSGQSLTPA